MCEDSTQGVINKFLAQFTRKELLAWFIIIDLVAITVGIAAWKFSQAKEVVDQIGFASSLASIIMAALAIIYAFFQTNASTEQNTLLQLNVQKIGEQVKDLSGISTEIAQFRTNFNERMQVISSIQGDLAQGNRKMEESISVMTNGLDQLKTKGDSTELIDKVREQLELLREYQSKQNIKVFENLESFVMGSVTKDLLYNTTIKLNSESEIDIEKLREYITNKNHNIKEIIFKDVGFKRKYIMSLYSVSPFDTNKIQDLIRESDSKILIAILGCGRAMPGVHVEIV